ncbi:acyl carrier protein [Pseudomonas sp. Z1-14]|uniref:acyl carrier protein n=1 Tax=Pseudomonas sp. Z1-14 TaxID=2817409 RepID=UPI003DAA0A22
MRLQLNEVVQEFIVSNGKIAHSYFSLSEKIIDSLCESNMAKESILMRLLEQAESVTAHYFNAHQQVLEGVYAHGIEAAAGRSVATLEPVPAHSTVLAAAPSTEEPVALSYEQWLRAEISSVTGFKNEQIDFERSFESLGIDSLGLVDIFESLAQHFPDKKEQTSELFDALTPTALLARLETDPKPSAAPSEAPLPGSADAQTQLGAVLFNALSPLVSDAPQSLDVNTPFTDLGLNGFDRQALCQSMAQECPVSEFAGEALMSRRTPEDALALLARIG